MRERHGISAVRRPALLLCLLLFGLVSAQPFLQAQTTSEQKKGSAVIRGQVVAADTGAPLAGIVVRAIADVNEIAKTGRVPAGSMSADDGSFELTQLAAGKYMLYATTGQDHPLYLSWAYGAVKFGPGTWIEVVEGQVVEKLNFRLPRASAMSGRVVNEKGDPLAWVEINAWVVDRSGTTPPRWPARYTDDYGRFRIFGLTPGQYVLKAETRGPEWAPAPDGSTALGYVPTFYPGALSADQAQVFSVEPGDEVNDLEVIVRRARTFRVAGAVVSPTSRERRARLAYSSDGHNWSTVSTNATGSFTLFGLTPGEYTLFGTTFDPSDPALEPEASGPVTVNVDQNLDGIVVYVKHGTRVRGRLSFDIGDEKLPPELRVRSMSPATAYAPLGIAPSAAVNEDGTFLLTRMFGRSIIGVVGLPPSIRQVVTYKRNDITDVPTEFADTSSPRDLEILLTTKGAEVRGRVVNSKDGPARDADVYLFPADKRRWILSGLAWRQATTDKDGRFAIKPLAAGDYFVVALDEPIWPLTRRMKDEDVFATLASIATPVQLVGNEVREISLTVTGLP